jgi:Xaa-Pro aminopeptidase
VRAVAFLILLLLPAPAWPQDAPLFTPAFPPEEFRERREKVYDAIGAQALALLQGASGPHSSARFRQSNQFFYLCGVETPNAYLLLDGARRRTALYLPHQDERRAATDGKKLSASEEEQARNLSGVDAVYGVELLGEHLGRYTYQRSPSVSVLYAPSQPGEGLSESRDGALRALSDLASDPWAGRGSSEGHLWRLLRARFPQLAIRDLAPVIDRLRLLKSPREIERIREATRLSGLALMEAMRSTEPGVREYELEALARFIFRRGGAQGDAYTAIVASGENAWYQHYRAGRRVMQDGELVVMDFAPDVDYYRSDLTRTWPVGGKFNGWQRELYGFYLACYQAILKGIEPGATPQQVKKNAARQMQAILARSSFSKPAYRQAAEKFVTDYEKSSQERESGLGHWIGMATHDVGSDFGPLSAGMVFTVEPALRVPEEKIYIRNEDAVLITETGVEILSAFVPLEIADIESLMREPGLLQRFAQPEIGRRRSP